jgi:hypothetical protein
MRGARHGRGEDTFSSATGQAAGSIGLAPADFADVAARWQFPPFVAGQKLHAEGVTCCATGSRGIRPVAVAVASASRLVDRRCVVARGGGHHLLVTVARLGVPAGWVPWLGATPAGMSLPVDRFFRLDRCGTEGLWATLPRGPGLRAGPLGEQVPVPLPTADQWEVRAHDVEYASAVLAELAPMLAAGPPYVWRVDWLDVVRIDQAPAGSVAPGPHDLAGLLDTVCTIADAVERVLRARHDDTGPTPAEPG